MAYYLKYIKHLVKYMWLVRGTTKENLKVFHVIIMQFLFISHRTFKKVKSNFITNEMYIINIRQEN